MLHIPYNFQYPCMNGCGRQNVGLTDEGLHAVKNAKFEHYKEPAWYNDRDCIFELVPACSNMSNVKQWLSVWSN